MRHQSRKIKIQKGIDANQMLVRKLTVNFLKSGKITTTEKKAKILKSYLERIVEKTKKRTESNKNYLLRSVANPKLVELLFSNVGPAVVARVGGYVKMEKQFERGSDGTLMVKLEWTSPIVMEEKKQEKVKPEKEIPEKNEKLK